MSLNSRPNFQDINYNLPNISKKKHHIAFNKNKYFIFYKLYSVCLQMASTVWTSYALEQQKSSVSSRVSFEIPWYELEVARLSYHNNDNNDITLEKLVSEMLYGTCYISPVWKSVSPLTGYTISHCLGLADSQAIMHLRSFSDCRVNVRKKIYCPPNANAWIFYLPLNHLWEMNPNLSSADIEGSLWKILSFMGRVRIIKKDDVTINLYMKEHSWYGFINFADHLTLEHMACIFTWLRENSWNLPKIPNHPKINVRYGKPNYNQN